MVYIRYIWYIIYVMHMSEFVFCQTQISMSHISAYEKQFSLEILRG